MSQMQKEGKKAIVAEQDALTLYLESLLSDVPEAHEPLPEPILEASAPAPVEAPPAPAPVFEPTQEPVSEPVVEQAAVPEAAMEEDTYWQGIPEWGQSEFQVLLFKLAGLNMAIPLVELDGILDWSDNLTPMPGRSPWYLGLLNNRGKTTPVIDLAQLVIPVNIRQQQAQKEDLDLGRVILIGDSKWGLACNSVSEVITLQSDQVRWRSSRTRRKWLAGTVIEHMCAMLDAEGLVHLLQSGKEVAA